MDSSTMEGRTPRLQEENSLLSSRDSRPGFTNRLANKLVYMLWAGLLMGFLLAVYSIRAQYTGALACFTVVFTPIGVGIDVVLRAVVKKSQAENTSKDGEGIRYTMISKEEPTI